MAEYTANAGMGTSQNRSRRAVIFNGCGDGLSREITCARVYRSAVATVICSSDFRRP